MRYSVLCCAVVYCHDHATLLLLFCGGSGWLQKFWRARSTRKLQTCTTSPWCAGSFSLGHALTKGLTRSRWVGLCVGYFPLKRRHTRFFTVDDDNLQCLIFSLLDSVDNKFSIDRLACWCHWLGTTTKYDIMAPFCFCSFWLIDGSTPEKMSDVRWCPRHSFNFDLQVAVKVLNNGLRPDIPQWCPPEFKALIEVRGDQAWLLPRSAVKPGVRARSLV